ncbi:MAG TPA: hypothetical protein PKM34_06875 [Bacteroidales bacterium]|nr:hypothetical protein [Bacteroidales bacterium]
MFFGQVNTVLVYKSIIKGRYTFCRNVSSPSGFPVKNFPDFILKVVHLAQESVVHFRQELLVRYAQEWVVQFGQEYSGDLQKHNAAL